MGKVKWIKLLEESIEYYLHNLEIYNYLTSAKYKGKMITWVTSKCKLDYISVKKLPIVSTKDTLNKVKVKPQI